MNLMNLMNLMKTANNTCCRCPVQTHAIINCLFKVVCWLRLCIKKDHMTHEKV